VVLGVVLVVHPLPPPAGELTTGSLRRAMRETLSKVIHCSSQRSPWNNQARAPNAPSLKASCGATWTGDDDDDDDDDDKEEGETGEEDNDEDNEGAVHGKK
jgi:hypothetical protein